MAHVMETLKCERECVCVSSYLGAYGRKDSYGMLRRNDLLYSMRVRCSSV